MQQIRKSNPRASYERIGTVTITEPIEKTRLYETASWYTKILCEPQTVTLESNGYYVRYRLEGTVTDEHFVNRVFWASSVAPKRNIGKRDSIYTSNYLYDLWRLMEAHTVTLDKGVRHEVETKQLETHTAHFSRLYRD